MRWCVEVCLDMCLSRSECFLYDLLHMKELVYLLGQAILHSLREASYPAEPKLKRGQRDPSLHLSCTLPAVGMISPNGSKAFRKTFTVTVTPLHLVI